jgi:Flp pilus assembly secretin CpaC
MRRLALTVLAAGLLTTPALAQSLSVPVDQAVRVGLSSPAKDVAVGNAAIADVTVMDERNILVLGKSFGTTNIVVLDRAGRMILNQMVVVTSADAGQVSLYRGTNAGQYVCAPRCEMTSGTDASKASPP